MKRFIDNTDTAYIKTGMYKGEWGTVEDYDGENFYIALWGDPDSVLVFEPSEIEIKQS